MEKYFSGSYYKHQNQDETLSVIVGETQDQAFVQVITKDKSYIFTYKEISESKCIFSKNGILLDLPQIKGKILYSDLTPIKYDIMGPFKLLPMQCKHGIVSMHHVLQGELRVENRIINFDDGVGYIENDKGKSFPKKYLWISCNNFIEKLSQKCSIMLSIADIPFCHTSFVGSIGIIIFNEKEFRFATYLGAKIILANKNKVVIRQGKYKLEITLNQKTSHPLSAPENGEMKNVIYESNDTEATFIFSKNKVQMFKLFSDKVSFEHEKLIIGN